MSLEIYTWKNNSKGQGFTKPVMSMLLGGNVGHASVELSFPADAKGVELAQKYQSIPGLSISKRTEIVPEMQENGSYHPKGQVNYFVYFSWWPGHINGHLIDSHKNDLESEWNNEPSSKLSDEVHEHIFGADAPAKNKTNIKGRLTPEKTITKLKEFSHEQLKRDIHDDLAFKELKAEQDALRTEMHPLLTKEANWKNEIINALNEKRPANQDVKLTEVESNHLVTISEALKRIKAQIELCKTDLEERHLSIGLPPSAVIRIPTTYDHNAFTFALDTEKVLDKMASLAKSTTAYSFYKFNCSTSATEVVKAGISDELKNIMKADGYNVENASKAIIATPTSFSNFCKQIQTKLIQLNTNRDLIAQQSIETASSSEASTEITENFKSRYQEVVSENEEDGDVSFVKQQA